MEIIYGQLHLSRNLPRCVATMGNFDGFHRGHQQLLQVLQEQAKLLDAPAVVITFEPQPLEVLQPARAQPRIMRLREKCHVVSTHQINYLVRLGFSKSLATCPADEFVRKVLVKQLGIQAIVVGDDFRFGAQRSGNVQLLQQLGDQLSFKILQVPPFLMEGERVSSTVVRRALQADNLNLTRKLLGRNYFLCGKIGRGDGRGKDWGFPTANIYLSGKPICIAGVYIVKVHGIDSQPLPGVACVGLRPMYPSKRAVLEVHLLNFNRDIYGKPVRVEFLQKLRDQQIFANTELLIEQIRADVQNTQRFFAC